jgi:4-diphosphocytidyl-2-C-methyl-D-erythritol kinase
MNVRALAPAKLNLGLEVLGRRPDGYHEIRTILVAVSIFDQLRSERALELFISVEGADLDERHNLVRTAAETLQDHCPGTPARIALRKRIPVASGLGGASADAAATLLVLDRLHGLKLSPAELHKTAAGLGSDVPFFLHGGLALASGRGERIESLPNVKPAYAVIVSPNLTIPNKTATLYGLLRASDFSDGSRAGVVAEALGRGELPPPELLENAFTRALYDRFEDLQSLPATMRRCGARTVALTGAGPSHYALFDDLDEAHQVATRLRYALTANAKVHCARFPVPGVLLCAPPNCAEK